MAFTNPQRINFSTDTEKYIEFLHEVIRTPMKEDEEFYGGFRNPHTQEYYELVFYNSGSRYVRVGEMEYLFGAGDIFAVNPDEEHSGKSVECMLDRYYLHISPKAFSDFKNEGELMGIFINRKKYTNNKITPAPQMRERIRKLLAEIDNTLRFGDDKIKDTQAYSLIIQLLCEVNTGAKGVHMKKDELFLNILSFIENSYSDADVLGEVMKSFAVSRSSLWRMFKAHLGTSPYSYLQNVRLENARLMLKMGEDVTGVSMRCGFSDCSHFIKKFKEKYSVTPLKYKNADLQ